MAILLTFYNYLYKENAKLGDFINKIWGNKTMVITYPNLTIQLADGNVEYLKNYYPEIQPYYLKLKKNINKKDNN